ncbi:TPA: hypothetical protein QDC22_007507 [Burkholderia stabilis]|nr:hypothetical protein [Burkholderia stabilis]HDR9589118.1 hypothetical protein [Burkholderia stabilis]HDR9649514.1 hypothetical protein [Burkholderia stabilis]HDR9653580.1 hypothetical protein [Burkholderia stabilis]HDR9656275.1 hypothetical protein [Burkholderia stabilis]
MPNKQFARGIFAEFGTVENPFQVPNGMEGNLRLIDDHIAILTLQPPQPPGELPDDADNGDAQIFSDGTYSVYNGGAWRTYPAMQGVVAGSLLGYLWRNTGSGWVKAIALESLSFLQLGIGAVERPASDKMRERVSAADYFKIGDLDFTNAIQRAIDYLAGRNGGEVWLPWGPVDISQTLINRSHYITLKGHGGAFDGNQPFQGTWDEIIARAGSRLVWKGAPQSFMFLHSPPDVLSPVSAPLQGGGFDGIMFDCNNIAQYGVKILSTRAARYTNSSVVRHTVRGMVLGVTEHDLYDGGSGTNTSLSLCEFENIVVSTAMIPGSTAKSVLMYGNGLKGGVNQCVFKSCQWFNADYTSRHIDIENTDDNTFFHCRWNGTLALHASDTGTNPVSNTFPGSLAQNHFFHACVGITEVLTTINPTSLTNLPSFGHIATSRSGNLPGFTVLQQMIVGAGADMTVIGDTLDFANRLGAMTWGAQPAITNCYLSEAQSIATASLTKLAWAGSQYDRLQGWKSATPTDIVVPNNIKWMTATLNVSWAANNTGERYAGIFLAGGPVGQDRRLASGNAEQPITTGVVPVIPGQVVDVRVSQTTGGNLNVANIARLTVEWH